MSYGGPIIHHDFTDGTNKGTGGSVYNLTNTGDLTFDTTTKVSGTSSVSITQITTNGYGVPQFKINSGVDGRHTMSFWIRMTPQTFIRYLFTATATGTPNSHVTADGLRTYAQTNDPNGYTTNDNTGFSLWSNSNDDQNIVKHTYILPPYNNFSETGYCDGNWHHYVLVSNNSGTENNYVLYIDNELAANNLLTNLSNNEDRIMFLAGCAWGSGNGYNIAGNVDEFRLYDYALNPTDIGGLYLSGLISSGASLIDLKAAGATVSQLINLNYTAEQLLEAGFSQFEIDIGITKIKIHSGFTISDGTNSSVFTTDDAVYSPTTFAAKLNTDFGYAENTITVGIDSTTTDNTPYYRIYLQFANAVTLTGMPKYIFNIPFSNFSVKAGGQVNFRNVNLDAEMTIEASYTTEYPFGQLGADIEGQFENEASGNYGAVSLSSDGSIVAIGAYNHDGEKGVARIYKNKIPTSTEWDSANVVIKGTDTAQVANKFYWTQLGTDIDGRVALERFGISLNLNSNGSIIVVGADRHATDVGAIRVYEYKIPTTTEWGTANVVMKGTDTDQVVDKLYWTQLGADINGIQAGELFGTGVSLSSDGRTVAAGAPLWFNSRGRASVYKYKIPTTTEWGTANVVVKGTDTDQVVDKFYWTQLGADLPHENVGDGVGYSVDLSSDGSIIAVATPFVTNSTGGARIYQYSTPGQTGGVWTKLGANINGVANGLENFGRPVALSSDGSIIACGAYNSKSGVGTARIYKYSTPGQVGGAWTQLGPDMNGDGSVESVGFSLGLSSDGSIAAISAYKNNSNTGTLRVYKYKIPTTTEWGTANVVIKGTDTTQVANKFYWTKIIPDINGVNAGEFFGSGVALSGDGTVVAGGASSYDVNRGTTRVYQLPGIAVISKTSTLPANNYFINDFVSTIETDLVNFTLSYDEPNKRITFDGLAQDISLSITSTDTTIFDTTITEITTTANTLPFLSYGQPDPTIQQYIENGITVNDYINNGYTVSQLLAVGFVPDWTLVTDANQFDQSYVKGFVDVSGTMVIRNDSNLIVDGNPTVDGNIAIIERPPIVVDPYTVLIPDSEFANYIDYSIPTTTDTISEGVNPYVLSDVSITSLDQIEVYSAYMDGGAITGPLSAVVYKYPIDQSGNSLQGNWIVGVFDNNYTKSARIAFTLNGTTPSIQQIGQCNYGGMNLTTSAENLISLYNDSNYNALYRETNYGYRVRTFSYTVTPGPVAQPLGTISFDSMILNSNLLIGEDISANGNVYIGGDLSVNGQFNGNFANNIIPLSAIISSGGGGDIVIGGNVLFAGDVSFNGPTVDVNIPPPPLRITDSILTETYVLNGITYKLIPLSSPVAITDVYITSLADIQPYSALITGSGIANTFECVFYKYETDHNGDPVANNWICGHYESAQNITRVCRIQFTLNGSISSIQQISRAYNSNFATPDTGSALGNGDYTSSAADLASLFNDTSVGSGPITADLNYALTDFYYNTPLSTVQWDTARIRESDLTGTWTQSNITYKLIPESPPAVITGLSIDSLDRIEPVSADMTGSNVGGGPYTCQGIYKYETDHTGAAVTNNWIIGAYDSGQNITKACRIKFTLNGTIVSIQQISKAYNKNYTYSGQNIRDTNSALGDGNYTSTAADLAKLFNDTTNIPGGFTYPIGSGPSTGLGYALTNVYYNYKVLTNNLNSYSKFIPVSICDSVVGYIPGATSITYKVLPLSSAVIPNATVYSLDQIELVKAYMTGPNINVTNGPLESVIYKYQDASGNIVPGNWICGVTEIGGGITYTKAVLLEFTLNGTNISVKHVSRSFTSTNASALGTSDYTSTAADLSRLFNDATVASNISNDKNYAITDASIKVSNTLLVNQIEFSNDSTVSTYDDNILSGTFAGGDVIFKDSTFVSVICEGTASAGTVEQSSDYRIKQNVTELNKTDTVDELVPIQYNNTLSGNHEFGLIAHELQKVYPELVVGEKDGAEYQRVHYNGLIGVLVKEVQELKQRFDALETRP